MADSNGTKKQNLLAILNAIDQTGTATASELTEQTGLSTATVSRGLALMKASRLLLQRKKPSTDPGRKPEYFAVNPGYGYWLYFLLDSTCLYGYLLDLRGRSAAEAQAEIQADLTAEDLLALITRLSGEIAQAGKKNRLLAVHIAVPGLVDLERGTVWRIPNFPNLEGEGLAKRVREDMGLPCYLHNTPRLTAFGAFLQAEPGVRNLVYMEITHGGGIGAGIVLDGQIYADRLCLAGEIGDMVINANHGSLPESDAQGVLEREAGLDGVFRQIQWLLQKGRAVRLRGLMAAADQQLTLPLIEQAIDRKDYDVYEVVNRAVRCWAAAVVNIAALLAPDVIVVGGAVGPENQTLCGMLRGHVDRMYHRHIDLRFCANGPAHLQGVAHLAKKALFDGIVEELLLDM